MSAADHAIEAEIQAKGLTAPGITPFKCSGCRATVTSFCPGDHSGCPNDFSAIRATVFGSNAVRPVKREELRVSNQEGLDEARCPLPLSVIPNNMGINLCNVKNVEWFTQDDGQLVSLTINFIPAE